MKTETQDLTLLQKEQTACQTVFQKNQSAEGPFLLGSQSAQRPFLLSSQSVQGTFLPDRQKANGTLLLGSQKVTGGQKMLTEMICVGVDAAGKEVMKEIRGRTFQELVENGVKLYREYNPTVDRIRTKALCPFRDYAKHWFTLYRQGTLRHTTASSYQSIINKHLLPAFGDCELSEITTDDIQQMLNEKKQYTPKMLHEIVMILGMILEGAVEDGYLPRNPARSTRLRNPGTNKGKPRRALTKKEITSVIHQLPSLTKERDRRYLALLVFTGMRREEVLGLRWSDVDELNGVIRIQRSITFKGNRAVVGDTKTENGKRMVPIFPALLTYLTKEEENREYIVHDNVTQQIVKRMWERIKKEINVFGATPHYFRHTFTTMCRRCGMDEKLMQSIGGWSDIETMRNVYTHIQEEDLQKAGGILRNMFEEVS